MTYTTTHYKLVKKYK